MPLVTSGSITAPYALAGGTWIFAGVVVALFFVVAFSYYTRTGSGISQTPYRRPDAPPEAPSELAHDITQDVRSWERGTEGHHRTRRRADQDTTDPAVAQALTEWRAAAGTTRQLATPIGDTDRVRGPADAPPVVLWIDISNEPCQSAYRVLATFAEDQRIRLAVRQLPLADVHRVALLAAEALEAAAAQGKFFELVDDLAAATPTSEDGLLDRAAALVPDGERLREAVQAGSHREAIVEQIRQATASGAPAVPAVYINAVRYDGTIKRDDIGRALRD
jgi:protein-disulfide isomerase